MIQLHDSEEEARRTKLGRQIARYRAKTTPERVRATFDEKGEAMAERYAAQAVLLRLVESKVCEVCNAAGVALTMRFWYQACARQMYGQWRRQGGESLEQELALVRMHWAGRGLNQKLLEELQVALIDALEKTRNA